MSEVTYYVALPFVFSDDGVAAGEAAECLSANAAVMRAEALSRKPGHAGAIAFSRTGDPSSGDFSDARLIRKLRAGRSQHLIRNEIARMRGQLRAQERQIQMPQRAGVASASAEILRMRAKVRRSLPRAGRFPQGRERGRAPHWIMRSTQGREEEGQRFGSSSRGDQRPHVRPRPFQRRSARAAMRPGLWYAFCDPAL